MIKPSRKEVFTQALFTPVDIASLVYFRIAFGLLLLVEMWRFFANDWIRNYFVGPAFFFTYTGFDWVQPWPSNGMYFHITVLILLLICIVFGLWYRIAMPLFFIGFSYIFLIDKTTYLNHFYLIILLSFLMSFMPANRAFSLDVLRRPLSHSRTTPAWTVLSLQAQLAIVHVYAGFAKLNGDWLRGQPMRIWLANNTDFPLIGAFFTEEWMVYLFSYGGLILDLAIIPLLLWRRTRPFAYLMAVLFHLTNARLFDIGIFPWLMIAATLLFFDPNWPRQVAARLTNRQKNWRRRVQSMKAKSAPTLPKRSTLMLLALYFAVQLLLPLRHVLYSGNTSWTEHGDRFAWRMMLYEKQGQVDFYALDPITNDVLFAIDARQNLSPAQYANMAKHPDMILQFTHFLAEEMRKEGYDDPHIHVEAIASLNGRPPQRMIDPTVNLVEQPRITLKTANWILPLYQFLSEQETP